ncbi:MAG TPA: glycosyltransferase family 2 protein [Steroidobacteraceae bacterium]|nr:glycosyltransferase family 2 protein [Steroidobacteraceae bacterium]
MRISIAMATYNGERYVREQLESLGAQTRMPDELVVRDDGSTDGTVEILRAFARAAPFPVRVYPGECNLGYTRNFLEAARLCTGDWIAFCDQDDVWLPEKLATIERYATTERCAAGGGTLLIVHSAETVDRNLTPTRVRYPDFRRRGVYGQFQLPTWWIVEGFVMAFRADLMSILPDEEQQRPAALPPMPRGHDAAICRLARILGDVVVLPDRLALHRWHGASLTTGGLADDVRGIRRSRNLFRRLRKLLSASGADLHLQQSRDAASQAQIYRYLGERQNREDWRRKLLLAETHYSAFSEWMATRARLCEEPSFWRRLGHLLRLAGGYARFSGSSLIGIRACAKAISLDVIVVLTGPDRFSRAPVDETVAAGRDRSPDR